MKQNRKTIQRLKNAKSLLFKKRKKFTNFTESDHEKGAITEIILCRKKRGFATNPT